MSNMSAGIMVAIGVLGLIFVSALVALIIVLKKRFCKPLDMISQQYLDNEPDADLVGHMEGLTENPSGVELDEVGLNNNLDQILKNEAWANDAVGLVPHCLAILKIAHMLTDKIVSVTLNNAQQLQFPETLTDLVSNARRIGTRVDDVVHAMYPPLDPRLLEARCSALVLAVGHLVMLAKTACNLSRVLDWVDQSLADVEDHLQALKDASVAYEMSLKSNMASSFSSLSSFPGAATNDPWECPATEISDSPGQLMNQGAVESSSRV